MKIKLLTLTLVVLVLLGCDPDQRSENDENRILFISAHPDDEGIFFGGTMAYYSRYLKIPTFLISMTSGDWAWDREPEVRELELINATASYMGKVVSSHSPHDENANLFFAGFKDCPTHADNGHGGYKNSVEATWDWWNDGKLDGYGSAGQDNEKGKQKTIETLATYFRVLKPTVVATHDIDGEYGHDNHIATSIAVIEAYDLAADADYIDGNDPWQVTKLYIHQPEHKIGTKGYTFENWLFHDYLEYGEIDNQLSARDITNVGLFSHATQDHPVVSTVYLEDERFDGYASEYWGLLKSTIGGDGVEPEFEINGKVYNGDCRSRDKDDDDDEKKLKWARGDFLIGL